MSGSAERPLADLLAALSARSPAPGGGSACAWSGALGAALVEMAALFGGDTESAERARALQSELLSLGERELHSYEPVLEAMRLSVSDPLRQERLARALSDASAAPLEIARATADVAELAADVAERGKPSLKGDAVTGVLLAEAASRAAAHLVEINLADSADHRRLDEVARSARRSAEARARVLSAPRPSL